MYSFKWHIISIIRYGPAIVQDEKLQFKLLVSTFVSHTLIEFQSKKIYESYH